MAPQLIQLLDDSYDAVRYSAGRSLRTLPGFATFETTSLPGLRCAAGSAGGDAAMDAGRGPDRARFGGNMLLGQDGGLLVDDMLRLMKQRNHRRMLLRE